MKTQPPFEVLWDDIVIGTTLFKLGDPPMGVAFGDFRPNASYRSEHLIDQDRLSARYEGEPVPSVGGVGILDGFEEFGERQVTIFGVGHPLYQKLFLHNVRAYQALFSEGRSIRGRLQLIAQTFRAAWGRCRRWSRRQIGRAICGDTTLLATVLCIDADQIVDWSSFHSVFKRELGFPNFYGNNMNAWIDCMSDLDDSDAGMTSTSVDKGELVVLKIQGAASYASRCPEQYHALIDACAFVNSRRQEVGQAAMLALLSVN
ncbi:MAG: barnase inhibitor [Marmoricola sp.]|nr:barnase inhibitor [Marmoricola sp.]